jgi:hypothetical protein
VFLIIVTNVNIGIVLLQSSLLSSAFLRCFSSFFLVVLSCFVLSFLQLFIHNFYFVEYTDEFGLCTPFFTNG